jgi:hypothetical protein
MSTEVKKDPCSLLVWMAPPARFLHVQDNSQGSNPDPEGALITPCLQDVKTANFRRWAVLASFSALLPLTLISLYSDRVRVKRRSARQKERDERWRKREARLNAEAAELGEDH